MESFSRFVHSRYDAWNKKLDLNPLKRKSKRLPRILESHGNAGYMLNVALIVDAEDLARSFVSHVLKSMQFEVIETNSEEEAWAVFQDREAEISYVFADIRLAQGNGISLYQRIRNCSESTVVVLSSSAPCEDASGIGEDAYGMSLLKPFTVDDLIRSTWLIEDPFRVAQAQ